MKGTGFAVVTRKITKAEYDGDGVKREILRILKQTGRDMEKDLESTVQTFDDPAHVPTWKYYISGAGGDLYVQVDIAIGTWAAEIYGFLDAGTTIRWAFMNDGWKSKTSPGKIASGAGAGSVKYKGKAEMNRAGLDMPQPGIPAREFYEQVAAKNLPAFFRNVESAVLAGLAKTKWSTTDIT